MLIPSGNSVAAGCLPIPTLRDSSDATASRYAVTSVDRDGRLADRSVLTFIGWAAELKIDLAIEPGPIVVACCSGNTAINPRGFLRLPLAVAAVAGSVPVIGCWSSRISDHNNCWSYRRPPSMTWWTPTVALTWARRHDDWIGPPA
jgi:hypothetical protein